MDVYKYKEAVRAWLEGAEITYIFSGGHKFKASSVKDAADLLSTIQIIPNPPIPHIHAVAISEWIKNPADWTVYFLAYRSTADWLLCDYNTAWLSENTYKLVSKSTGKEIISHGQC